MNLSHTQKTTLILAVLVTTVGATLLAENVPTLNLGDSTKQRYSASQRIAVLKAIAAEIPTNAVVIDPGMNIQSAVSKYPPGTAFRLKAGMHRLQSIVPKDGMAFYGEIDRDGKLLTTLSGAAVLKNVNKNAPLHAFAGQKHKGGRVAFYGGKIFTPKRREGSRCVGDVFFNNVPLKHGL